MSTRRYIHTEYYEFIGVAPHASDEEIRKAYKQKAALWHPDRNPAHEDKFKHLQKVNEVLSNADKRKRYDHAGEEGVERGPSIFDPFDGQKKKRGDNYARQLGVDLEGLYTGVTKTVKLHKRIICPTCNGLGAKSKAAVQNCRKCGGSGREIRFVVRGPFQQQVAVPCSGCKGDGEINTSPCTECHGQKVSQGVSDLKIVIDPGKSDGDKVVLAGEADQTPGVQPGDIIFLIKELPHAVFRRMGTDLYMKKRIALRDALCGTVFSFKHLDGRTVVVRTTPGEVISPGLCKHIDGEGMPEVGTIYRKGRLFIDFDIEFPAKGALSAEQMGLLAKALPAPKEPSAIPATGVEEVEMSDTLPEMLAAGAQSAAEAKKKQREAYEGDESEEEQQQEGPGVACHPQ